MLRRASHLVAFLWFVSGLLYGGAWARASEAPAAPPTSGQARKAPHIALLLPAGSEAFAQASEAVRAGFADAAKKQPAVTLAIRLYPVTEDLQNVIASYRQATA